MNLPRAFRLADLAALQGELTWSPMRPGVERHILYENGTDGPSAALLRYAPGASVPRHVHVGYEHIFVISGAQEDDHGRYEAGTMIVNAPGSAHQVRSPEGCVVLVLWERNVRFEAHE